MGDRKTPRVIRGLEVTHVSVGPDGFGVGGVVRPEDVSVDVRQTPAGPAYHVEAWVPLPPALADEARRALAADEAPKQRPPADPAGAARCCWCGGLVSRDAGDRFALNLERRGLGGFRLVLHWHGRAPAGAASPCIEADPLHMAFADAMNIPDGPEGDEACRRAYMAIRDRVAAEQGAAGLRACIHVRRDHGDEALTLRGVGLDWGRLRARAHWGPL